MNRTQLIATVLTVCFLHLPGAWGEDDKMTDYQKQQLKIQQWKLEQMKKLPQPQTKPTAPAKPATQSSAQNNVPVKLVVTNRSAAPVAVIWIAFDGTPTPFGTIKPGAQFVQQTFSGHAWQFRTGQKVIKSYTATAQPVQQFGVGTAVANAPVTTPKVNPGNPVVGTKPSTPKLVDSPVLTNPGPPINNPINPVATADTKIADFLQVHNAARAAVGVPPLKWSAKLAQNAQAWADQLEATGQFAHNPGTTYGENLAGHSPPFTPAGGAKMWLEEKKDYQPGQPGGGNAGHYTQMVWRQTTHVGFGVAKVKGMTVIVANYDPAGNINNDPPY